MKSAFIEFKETFWKHVSLANDIVVTSHMSPDDDSIGSVLAMFTIITTQYPTKKVRIIYTGEQVSRYKTFDNFEQIQFVSDVANELESADLLILLDANQYARASKNPQRLASVKTTIIIDHHASTEDEATLTTIQPTYSSNAELLYRIFVEDAPLTRALASYYLLGILGDTGNFSYVTPWQAGVFPLAEQLIEHVGMSISEFRTSYGSIPRHLFPLLLELYKNTNYGSDNNWPPFQYSYITRDVVEGGHYSDNDISAASHIYMGQFLTRIEGHAWGFVLTPRADGSVRISTRSLPKSVNVRKFCEDLAVGSGHDRASGGTFKKEGTDLDVVETLRKILQWMETHPSVIG